jgi:hypothetical protein
MVTLPAREVAACGGCFAPPIANTQVAYHRMVLSVSQAQSTLWDEISYSGDPASFAWVLPTRGVVTVGTSSDILFAELDQISAVQVAPPPSSVCNCPYCDDYTDDTSTDDSDTAGGGGVTVISQSVVGPYETVQLSSTDPTALTTWLTSHGYAIPSDVAPMIGAYVGEGFDFLALKLVPGMGVSTMKPVRVTTPGASLSLPLRMVAAGAGATVPITLFVVGEGRYEPTNFPWFTVNPSQVVFDYATYSSNYTTLEQGSFAQTLGAGWSIESAQPTSASGIESAIQGTVSFDPVDSGYGDSMGNGAAADAGADLAALVYNIDQTSMWLTRMYAELPRSVLATDLAIGASKDQSVISNLIQAASAVNVPPCDCSCPLPYPTDPVNASSGSGCAVVATRSAASALAAAFLGIALMTARRRTTRGSRQAAPAAGSPSA